VVVVIVGRRGGLSSRCSLTDGGLKPLVIVVGAECAAALPQEERCGDGRSTSVVVVADVDGRSDGRNIRCSGCFDLGRVRPCTSGCCSGFNGSISMETRYDRSRCLYLLGLFYFVLPF
jgi:hypothetical protein